MKNGQEISHCSLLETVNGLSVYSEPKEYTLKLNYLTIQPKTGNRNILPYGVGVARAWNGIANARIFDNVFKEGDLLYLDGTVPNDDEIENGQTANGYIDSVQVQNMAIKLEISKRVY